MKPPEFFFDKRTGLHKASTTITLQFGSKKRYESGFYVEGWGKSSVEALKILKENVKIARKEAKFI